MNTSRIHSPAAEEQAALWAARLDGSELSAADQAELKAWLAEDPAHRALLSQYCQFSADLEERLPLLVEAGAVKMPTTKPAARGTRFGWFAGLAVAAAAAVALVLWLGRAPSASGVLQIATAVAQRQPLTLPDGSHLELNANTSLTYENTGAERRARLITGEAFFKVAKDKAHPFIVETAAGSVRVTGTQFNVRADTAAELEVTVAEGSVQVRPAGGGAEDPVALTANDQLTARNGIVTRAKLSADSLEAALAWRQGELKADSAEGVRLADALARLARYHGRSYAVEDPALANKRLAGSYALDDVETFLGFLEKNWPEAQVVRAPNGDIVIRARVTK